MVFTAGNLVMQEVIVVGLDLGTASGYVRAMYNIERGIHDARSDEFFNPRIVGVGTYKLASARRWVGYRTLLSEIAGDAHAIYYEDVPSAVHVGGTAARIHGGLRATLELFSHDNKIKLYGVSIQKAKRALTGSGGAGKELMVRAARKRFGCIVDHNAADALGVLLAGVQQ
jgi:hypothetical protein